MIKKIIFLTVYMILSINTYTMFDETEKRNTLDYISNPHIHWNDKTFTFSMDYNDGNPDDISVVLMHSTIQILYKKHMLKKIPNANIQFYQLRELTTELRLPSVPYIPLVVCTDKNNITIQGEWIQKRKPTKDAIVSLIKVKNVAVI